MNIKLIQFKKLVINWLIKSWYTSMKPLALVVDRISKKRYNADELKDSNLFIGLAQEYMLR